VYIVIPPITLVVVFLQEESKNLCCENILLLLLPLLLLLLLVLVCRIPPLPAVFTPLLLQQRLLARLIDSAHTPLPEDKEEEKDANFIVTIRKQ
jgi:hypothetical protein